MCGNKKDDEISRFFSFLKQTFNDQFLVAGNFLSLTRNWNPGDKITLELPISLRTETIKGISVGMNQINL